MRTSELNGWWEIVSAVSNFFMRAIFRVHVEGAWHVPSQGSAIVAFVTLEGSHLASPELNAELRAHVAKEIGALARPDEIRFSDMLPKTRSGKIMRRLLREIATSGTVAGDVTTLEDFSVLEKLRADEE